MSSRIKASNGNLGRAGDKALVPITKFVIAPRLSSRKTRRPRRPPPKRLISITWWREWPQKHIHSSPRAPTRSHSRKPRHNRVCEPITSISSYLRLGSSNVASLSLATNLALLAGICVSRLLPLYPNRLRSPLTHNNNRGLHCVVFFDLESTAKFRRVEKSWDNFKMWQGVI